MTARKIRLDEQDLTVALQFLWSDKRSWSATRMMANTPTTQLLASYFDRQASTGLSKYMALRGAILHMIEERHWQPGDQVPPEQEFTRLVNVSLGTVQKSLRLLAEDGILSREHGRGTFVKVDSTRLNNPHHFRFVGDDNQTLLPIYTDVIGCDIVSTTGAWSHFLGDDPCVCLQRVIDVNHEFNCYALFYLQAEQFGSLCDLSLQTLNGMNLKHLLAKQFGVETRQINYRLRAGEIPPAACDVLGLSRQAIGLIAENFGRTHQKRPLYYQQLFVPPTNRRLMMEDFA